MTSRHIFPINYNIFLFVNIIEPFILYFIKIIVIVTLFNDQAAKYQKKTKHTKRRSIIKVNNRDE